MEKLYRAKRHLRRQSHVIKLQRFGWVIACLLIVAVLAGLVVQIQQLTTENGSLKAQLATLSTKSSTCSVVGNWTANQSKQESLGVDGMQRSYLIHLPTGFKNSTYYPLVLFFVGRGASVQAAEQAYNLDQLPAIVVYPTPTVGGQDMTAWQSAPYSSGANDVAFTSAILSNVQSNLCIDRDHIYATGMSNGGGLVSLLSCELPDRFAAYAVVAGAFYLPDGNCKPPKPTPLISIHGDQDRTVPYDGSLTRQLPATEDWVTQRAADNGCKKSPTTTYPSTNIVATTWIGCKNDATVENIRVEGGGHEWGGLPNTSLWQFLSQFSL
jgi:polyhydroxybutyrate depolymerase